jgi:hypothetical protein
MFSMIMTLALPAAALPPGSTVHHPAVGTGGLHKPDKFPLPSGLNWAMAPQHFDAFCEQHNAEYTEIDNDDNFFMTKSCFFKELHIDDMVVNNIQVSASYSSSFGVGQFTFVRYFDDVVSFTMAYQNVARSVQEKDTYDDSKAVLLANRMNGSLILAVVTNAKAIY